MAIDIFAIGLILFELHLGERFLQDCWDDFHVLAIMHILVGPMPEKMAREGRNSVPHMFMVLNGPVTRRRLTRGRWGMMMSSGIW